jgi:hypothetical protein
VYCSYNSDLQISLFCYTSNTTNLDLNFCILVDLTMSYIKNFHFEIFEKQAPWSSGAICPFPGTVGLQIVWSLIFSILKSYVGSIAQNYRISLLNLDREVVICMIKSQFRQLCLLATHALISMPKLILFNALATSVKLFFRITHFLQTTTTTMPSKRIQECPFCCLYFKILWTHTHEHTIYNILRGIN